MDAAFYLLSSAFNLFVWALIWAIICAVIASNRGRSAFGWFVIGFLLSPLGLLMLVLLSNPRKEREERMRQEAYRPESPIFRDRPK